MRNFISRHLLIESTILFVLLVLFWMITRVQPSGELSGSGAAVAEVLDKWFSSIHMFWNGGQETNTLMLVQARTWPESTAFSGFCGMAEIASVYVKNSSTLSYFVIIPAFLIVVFAYNRSKPDAFSRPGRVVFAFLLISFIYILTFKVIQLQDVQSIVVSLPADAFFIEDHNFRCDAAFEIGQDTKAQLALYLGNLTAFLGEIRLYLLGLVLWIIGREHADIRRLQKLAAETPEGGN
ncbi:hypothetical protein QTO30_20070 [Yoonia sp. GPGPB17]|uniref:hypothetical protein n=1 Tax=Yoonia sp. GPGPB17 TaxID=3026147 RepID=UPI0030BFC8D8